MRSGLEQDLEHLALERASKGVLSPSRPDADVFSRASSLSSAAPRSWSCPRNLEPRGLGRGRGNGSEARLGEWKISPQRLARPLRIIVMAFCCCSRRDHFFKTKRQHSVHFFLFGKGQLLSPYPHEIRAAFDVQTIDVRLLPFVPGAASTAAGPLPAPACAAGASQGDRPPERRSLQSR